MPEDPRYDPQSLDSILSRILAKLDTIDSTCSEIRTEAKKTNGRVNGLERFRDTLTAKVAGISATLGVVGGGVLWLFKIIVGH